MASAIDPNFITSGPVSKSGMVTQLTRARDEITALQRAHKGPSAPSTPEAGQLWLEDDTPSVTVWTLHIYDGTDWIALGQLDTVNNSFILANFGDVLRYRNRIVNPAMQISQERGTALVDVTTFAYTVDQWLTGLSVSPGGTVRVQQIASLTPGGSPFRLRHTAQVADASIAAGDYYAIEQIVEGVNVADAAFGTASARQVLLRIGVRSSVAGTFGVSIANSAANRSCVATITIGAGEVNTDLVRTLVIPGDTTGTWLTDTGIGLRLRIALASGTTFHGTAGWQSANVLTTAAQTNFMATGGATFELFDVGLYVDTLGLGVFPPFEVPDFGEELRRCQRYYTEVQIQFSGATVSGVSATAMTNLPIMRASPVVSASNQYNTGSIGATPTVTAWIAGYFTYVQDVRAVGAGTWGTYGTYIKLSARL